MYGKIGALVVEFQSLIGGKKRAYYLVDEMNFSWAV